MSDLPPKYKAIILIAAFTAIGDRTQLKNAIIHNLDNASLSVNEIKEITLQLYAYIGFPRSINGMSVLMNTINEREKQNIKDNVGIEAIPLDTNQNSLTIGKNIQTELAGQEVSSPLFDFCPALNQFLRAHLFGDIFGRNLLTYQERELATISALSTYQGIEEQLKAHFNIAINTGLTKIQLTSITQIISSKINIQLGQHALHMLQQI